MRKGAIALTTREQQRAQQLTRVLEGAITPKEAAIRPGLRSRLALRLQGPAEVQADNTTSYFGRIIQIPPGPDRLSYVRAIVEVHERLDHSIAICYQKRVLLVIPNLDVQPRPLRTHQCAQRYAPPGSSRS